MENAPEAQEGTRWEGGDRGCTSRPTHTASSAAFGWVFVGQTLHTAILHCIWIQYHHLGFLSPLSPIQHKDCAQSWQFLVPARSWAQPPLAWKGTSRQVTSAHVWDITSCSLTQAQTKTHLSFKIRRPHALAQSILTKQQHALMPWRKSCCKSGFCIVRDLSLLILIKTVGDLSFLKAPSKHKLKYINLQHKTLRRGRNSLISGKLLKYLLYPPHP